MQDNGTLQTFPDLPCEDRLIYIAGPFFNDAQRKAIDDIETLLNRRQEKFFSPREYGVIVDGPMGKDRIERIFDMNVRMIRECNILLAITDDFDPGTMMEIGMFYSKFHWQRSKKPPIITYSPNGYGANVMIANAIFTHTRSYEELDHALNGHEVDQLEAAE